MFWYNWFLYNIEIFEIFWLEILEKVLDFLFIYLRFLVYDVKLLEYIMLLMFLLEEKKFWLFKCILIYWIKYVGFEFM